MTVSPLEDPTEDEKSNFCKEMIFLFVEIQPKTPCSIF